MPPDMRRCFVNVYTDIFNGSFPTRMTNRLATGDELYAFLVSDACLCWSEELGRFLRGDAVLWHLGLSPGYGCLICDSHHFVWAAGQASFDLIRQFVDALHADHVFNPSQHQKLNHMIRQARGFGSLADLRSHLEVLEENQPCLSSCCNSGVSKPCLPARPCRAIW